MKYFIGVVTLYDLCEYNRWEPAVTPIIETQTREKTKMDFYY